MRIISLLSLTVALACNQGFVNDKAYRVDTAAGTDTAEADTDTDTDSDRAAQEFLSRWTGTPTPSSAAAVECCEHRPPLWSSVSLWQKAIWLKRASVSAPLRP